MKEDVVLNYIGKYQVIIVSMGTDLFLDSILDGYENQKIFWKKNFANCFKDFHAIKKQICIT